MRVIIREAAYDDLDRIYSWIAKDDPRAADAVSERILESAGRVGRFPYIGHAGSVPGTYEWVVPHLPYIIVYQLRTELISIEAVFHAAQQRKQK